MTHLKQCDKPMRASLKKTAPAGQYLLVTSFPPRGLHDHPVKQVPDHVKFADITGRVIQFDFVGPRGLRQSYELEIPQFIAMPPPVAQELHEVELAFAIASDAPFKNLVGQVHDRLKLSLQQEMEDAVRPQQPGKDRPQ